MKRTDITKAEMSAAESILEQAGWTRGVNDTWIDPHSCLPYTVMTAFAVQHQRMEEKKAREKVEVVAK